MLNLLSFKLFKLFIINIFVLHVKKLFSSKLTSQISHNLATFNITYVLVSYLNSS